MSNKLTDKEIFDWLKSNNAALEKITNKIASESNFKDREDIKSIVYINAVRILKSYDKSKKSKIITFVLNYTIGRAREEYYKTKSIVSASHSNIMKNKIIDYQSLNTKYNFDDAEEIINFIKDDTIDFNNKDKILDFRRTYEDIINYAKQVLPVRTIYILKQRYIYGRKLQDLAKELHISNQRVAQLEHNALNKIRRVYNNDKYRIYE